MARSPEIESEKSFGETTRNGKQGELRQLCSAGLDLSSKNTAWRPSGNAARVKAIRKLGQITLAGMVLTLRPGLGIKELAAVAATRGDLGQLAPRKKLLKSW